MVVKDVPAGRTVVGMPARMVGTRAGGRAPATDGIDLDHHLMPDPVAKSIACLLERIETLEKELAEAAPRTAAARPQRAMRDLHCRRAVLRARSHAP